jgi:hypothetical protein
MTNPKRRRAAALQIYLVVTLTLLPDVALAQHRTIATVTVNISQPVNRFTPSHALGAAIDGHEKGINDLQFKPDNIRAMLSAGLRPLTYRLRTELGMGVWHWNPSGSWSDQGRRQGYWVSDSDLQKPISLSYGYSLPRRGNTIDQAANNGYSRLDDGDENTSWKSNPYLDSHFTGEANDVHPQWIVIEFARPEPINAMRVAWGEPFAKRFRIQYASFNDPSVISLSPPGAWTDFPNAQFDRSAANPGSDLILQLSRKPITVGLIRIIFAESSGTNHLATADLRDRLGFAVRELYAGTIDESGAFHDRIRHGLNLSDQTIIHVSSTDPWHRESDRDNEIEQVGLDRLYQSGLTNNLPMLVPTGLLYDTPENAANEIRYLRARGYKFDQVELGEEPDGQYITPEDFGTLYLQFADAIHRVDPKLQLGGPSFQEILPSHDPIYPVDNAAWMRRFLAYLKARNRTADFAFFSFEWYPFDDVCAPPAPQLASAQQMLKEAMETLERRGTVPRNIPWIISEYGYSAFASRAELSMEGALLHADIAGEFLTLGGDQAFLYGYAPDVVIEERDCTAGNNMLFSMDDEGKIEHRFATYFAARLLTHQWVMPGDGAHEIYSASSDIKDGNGNQLLTAYALRRPDGLWSLMLINKDPKQSFSVKLIFRGERGDREATMEAPIDIYQYSEAQYQLGGPVKDPYPTRAQEPAHNVMNAPRSENPMIVVPPYSMTIVRGNLSRASSGGR